MRRYLLSTLAILFVPLCGLAQTGLPPFASIERMNLDLRNNQNLNVVLAIPIVSNPGRGLNLDFSVVYNSLSWAPGGGVWNPAFNSNPNALWGWQLTFTPNQTTYVSTTTQGTCGRIAGNTGNTYTTQYRNFQYVDPYGTAHRFPLVWWKDVYSDCTGTDTITGTFTGSSGDGYYISISSADGSITSVLNRGGFDVTTPGKTIDRNGNYISSSNPQSGETDWTDTLGRVALKVISGSSSIQYKFPAPNGNYQTYTVNLQSLNIKTNFSCSGIVEYNGAVNLPVSLSLPDGSAYQFTYEPTPGNSGYYTGRLQRVTLPMGGYYEYDYTGPNDGINCADGTTLSINRVVNDGTNTSTWKFSRNLSNLTATITTPAPADTVVTFNTSGQETSRKIYKESPGVNVLRTINTTWAANGTPATQVTILDNGSTQSEVDTTYDSNGLLDLQSEYDWGSGAHGNLLRSTTLTYQPSSAYTSKNILDLVTSKVVKNGAGTIVAQTNFNYDETAVAGSSGTPQHTVVSGARGNLTSINYPVSGLTPHFAYYDTGTVSTTTDVNGAVTTYNYPDATSTCGNAFPTSVSEPLGLSRFMTWNCSGPVQLTATDENNKTITTSYNDAYFWRPNAITDQTGAQTTYYYQPSTQYCCPWEVASNLTFNNGNSQVTHYQYMDGLGRPFVDQQYDFARSNLDTISYTFDANGRLYSTSVPCLAGWANGCPSSSAKTTQTYDALNRPLVTTDGGGGIITNTYTQNDVYVSVNAPSGENAKRRNLEYDALGRLTSVCEVTGASGSGPCGQSVAYNGFLTKYTYPYDPQAHPQMIVTQNAQAPTAQQQTRTFTYDSMNRLLSESNPESGTTTYTYDVIPSGCWAAGTAQAGDLTRKQDAAGNSLCVTYDALHRPTGIGPSSVPPCRRFSYDKTSNGVVPVPSGVTVNNAVGRLVEAETDNCGNWPPIPITDEWFSYTARGEISDVYASTPHSGGYYHSALTYWADGAPNVLTGPAGYYASWNVDAEGRPYQVPNLVTNTVYNTAGLPTGVTYASGDSDSLTYDSSTNRMTQYKFTVGSSPQSVVANLTWNTNGTLQTQNITDPFNSANTQNCSYGYDDLSRLGNASCGTAAAQTFTYDPFGNISKSGSPYSFQPGYSSATNRMTSIGSFTPTYDGAGDVTNDSLHTYTWDNFGLPMTVDGVSLTYDAWGRMVEQNRSGAYTQLVYSPTGQKMQIMNGQASTKSIVALPGGGQAVYNSTSLLYYAHPDHLGSTRFASTPSRTMYFDLAYAPFGETYAASGSTDLSFTGQRQGTVSGLYDFPAREYSIQGRWPSPDPAGLAAVDLSNPQSWNRYAYVLNNPLNSVDPLGMSDCPDLKAQCGDIFGDPGGAPGVDIFGGFNYGPNNPGNGCDTLMDIECETNREIAQNICSQNAAGCTALSALQSASADFVNSIDQENMRLSQPPGGRASETIIVHCLGDGFASWECSPWGPYGQLLAAGSGPYFSDDNARLRYIARGVVAGAGGIGDPRVIAGFYGASAALAAPGAIAIDIARGPWESALFGRNGGFLNSFDQIRIGFGWYDKIGQNVFRITGDWLNGAHLLNWPW